MKICTKCVQKKKSWNILRQAECHGTELLGEWKIYSNYSSSEIVRTNGVDPAVLRNVSINSMMSISLFGMESTSFSCN